LHEANDQDDCGEDQQKVEEPTQKIVADHADQPQNQKDHENRPKHTATSDLELGRPPASDAAETRCPFD
jgi:hypothetical protein